MLQSSKNVVVPTVVETTGMQGWLGLAAAGLAPLGLGILAVTLTIEHALIRKFFGKLGFGGVARAFVVSVIETGLWGIGLVLWHINPILSSGFLVGTINVEHTIQDSYFKGLPLFSRLFNPRRLGVTAIEVVGFAAAMIVIGFLGPIGAIVGAPLFFIANLVEHKKIVAS